MFVEVEHDPPLLQKQQQISHGTGDPASSLWEKLLELLRYERGDLRGGTILQVPPRLDLGQPAGNKREIRCKTLHYVTPQIKAG